jgi:N-acetyl-anhydromuramyl-L-alanine amidase AmpD
MKVGDKGDTVRQLQLALISMGYPLPRFGADASFGRETQSALHLFADDHFISDLNDQQLVAEALRISKVVKTRKIPAGIRHYDFIGRGPRVYATRSWKDTWAICLHQTAVAVYDPGDNIDFFAEQKAAERIARFSAHCNVMRSGALVEMGRPTDCIAHAQRVFNRCSIGMEFDGHYAGVEGDLKTYWRPASEPNRQPLKLLDRQVATGLAWIDFLIEEVASHDGKITHIFAHRQTANDRTSDPGSEIWSKVAIPAIKKHNLSYGGPDFYVPPLRGAVENGVWSDAGPGWPIPKEWDPSATHPYRKRFTPPSKMSRP